MNEIKQIHLGRQSFTVSVEAYKELRDYLDAIKRQVGSNGADVVEEVELRLAELLTERGITGDKVVLPSDVVFLKEQLGEPRDFKEDSDESEPVAKSEETSRRLFRDTEHGMIAGVASGLAAYLGIDAVIIRLLFVLLMFGGGAGVFIYIILWLIVPEVRTTSDRLQMHGKAVTVGSLKEVVDRADVPGAARRAHNTFGRVIEGIFKVALAVFGTILSIGSILGLLWITTMSIYILTHHARLGGEVFFPIGTNETAAFVAAVVAGGVILLFTLLIGISMVRRRWQLSGWVVAALIGVFFVAGSVGGALSFDVVPKIEDRYQALHHSQIKPVAAFTSVDLNGQDTQFSFVPDSKYFVEYYYFGAADTSRIKTSVDNGTLKVDTNAFVAKQFCFHLCFSHDESLRITIHAPVLTMISVAGSGADFESYSRLSQPTLALSVAEDSSAYVSAIYPAKATLADNGSGTRHIEMTLQPQASDSDGVSFGEDGFVTINRAGELDINNDRECDANDPFIFVQDSVDTLRLNGKTVPSSPEDYYQLRNYDQNNVYNCVALHTETPLKSVPPVPIRPSENL